MKRHEALYPLSHHHHHALVTAVELKKAGTEKAEKSLQDYRRSVIEFWEQNGRNHFRDEEEVLLPLFAHYGDVDQEPVKEMLIQHAKIRGMVEQLREQARLSAEQFRELGELLDAHVRLEERTIFPMIEEVVPEKLLYQANGRFHRDSVSGR
ncbi:hemerythrin domain-containing protein [Thalassobacillus pellis]|uniref:hemerythrin domain-containing protein n=1 Tax=Thalassobacillus pellis TaxID=748008 RepID=UPI001960DB91|nr:hemerythrin domain-containing protein [Thalassobacillus pellis]MBM7552037.1 hemerythrin-like domain-containing protein [Thalassobacillus pellis]